MGVMPWIMEGKSNKQPTKERVAAMMLSDLLCPGKNWRGDALWFLCWAWHCVGGGMLHGFVLARLDQRAGLTLLHLLVSMQEWHAMCVGLCRWFFGGSWGGVQDEFDCVLRAGSNKGGIIRPGRWHSQARVKVPYDQFSRSAMYWWWFFGYTQQQAMTVTWWYEFDMCFACRQQQGWYNTPGKVAQSGKGQSSLWPIQQ